MRGPTSSKADLVKVNIQRRRRAEASGEWRQRHAVRAGTEGTNSELKRRHGLGRLRVRGGLRVRLAVYLKALVCNIVPSKRRRAKRKRPGKRLWWSLRDPDTPFDCLKACLWVARRQRVPGGGRYRDHREPGKN